MAWIDPLDLKSILINLLSGNIDIFIGLSVVFLAGAAAYFRLQNEIVLVMLALYFIIMAPFIGISYAMIITIITSLLVYFIISKIVK